MADRIPYALSSLNADPFRSAVPFSSDFVVAHEVLINNPYAVDANREEVLNNWIQRYQPCLFGKVAAAKGRIHYCFISDDDLSRGEEWVRSKISRERRLWKARALDPAGSGLTPAHSFVLHVASARVASAAPDNSLKSLAKLIRELWGCPVHTDPEGNDIATERLYLKSPAGGFVRFDINIDFFAAQGDGRWWHDHRVPGGIAFTANATGHMARYREWYEQKADHDDFTLNAAMRTIAGAKQTEWGAATALIPLEEGDPIAPSRCPFPLHPSLAGKDWTRYRAYFDTDHSIREEFFRPGPAREAASDARDWLQDLTYIFDAANPEHSSLMTGEAADRNEVEQAVGSIDTWRRRPGRLRIRADRLGQYAAAAFGKVRSSQLRESLARSREWRLTPAELASLA